MAWLLVAALASWLWLPNLFTHGMFVDGVIHATVSQKLALGEASFWDLRENYMDNGPYRGHPPLVFYLQSLFFRFLGQGFYVEKFYSLITALLQMLLLATGWRLWFFDRPMAQPFAWLPVLLWLSSPLTGWCYSSNMLENTQSLFTTAAVFTLAYWIRKGGSWLLASVIAMLLMFAALLCKGPLALFVLAMPLLFVHAYKRPSFAHAWMMTSVLVFGLLAVFNLLLSYPPAYTFLKEYIQLQLKPALSKGYSNYQILLDMLFALSVPFLFMVIAFIISMMRKTMRWDEDKAYALRWLALALAASLPILLSAKQSRFYLMPSIPLFAMAFALATYSVFTQGKCGFAPKYIKATALALILTIVFFVLQGSYRFGQVGRYPELMADVRQIITQVAARSFINVDWNVAEEYHLRAYLYRYAGIVTCTPSRSCGATQWLLDKNIHAEDSKRLMYQGNTINLYRLKD